MNASLWQLAGWTMIHSLWLGAAVALAGGFLRLAARRAAPNTRYAISLGALALLAATPIAAAAWLSVNGVPQLAAIGAHEINLLPLPLGEGWGEGQSQVHALNPHSLQAATPNAQNKPAPGRMPGLSGPVIDLAQATPAELDVQAAQQQSPQAPPTNAQPPRPPTAILFPSTSRQSPIIDHPSPTYSPTHLLTYSLNLLPTLWLIGAPLTFTLLATGLIGSERLRRRATPLTAGPAFDACQRLRQTLNITRRVALAVCDDVAQPILVGIVRPLILLPTAALAGWTPEQLDMVLLHELAHVRRWDNLVNLLQRIVESLLFFHPAVWLVSRQVRRDREECCDAAVIRHTDRPHQYAELLVSIAAALRGGPAPSLAVASAMASHPLAGRIRRILNIEAEPMRITRRTLAATLLLPLLLAGAIFYSGASAQAPETGGPSSPNQGGVTTKNVSDKTQSTPKTKANADGQQLGDYQVSYNAADLETVNFHQWMNLIASNSKIAIKWFPDNKSFVITADASGHQKISEFLAYARNYSEQKRRSSATLETKGDYRTQVELLQLQNEIRGLEDLIVKAQKDLVDIEVFKELSIQSASSPGVVKAAIDVELGKDPTIQLYEQQLVDLNSQLQAKLSPSKNPDVVELKRLRATIQQTEDQAAKYRNEAESALREKIAKMPNDALRSAMIEYKIRRKSIEDNLNRRKQDLEAAKTKLAKLTASGNPPPQPASLLDRLEQLRAAFDAQRPLFEKDPNSPVQKVRYDGANLPDIVGDHWPYLIKGISNEPGKPPIWFNWTGLGNKNYELEVPAAAHEKFFRPMFDGKLPTMDAGAPGSPNQGGAATGSLLSLADAQSEISQLQNEIRKFEDLTVKAQKELVDLEVFKELSAQSGPGRSSGLEEAIAEDLAQDPTINTYKSQLVELNATLQTKLSESKNPNTPEIKRLRTVIQQTEAEMAKYQAEASRALREKYAYLPKNAKLAAEREYKIRRLGVEVDLAEYQQQLLHYKQKLAEANAQLGVPQAIGTYATPMIAAAGAFEKHVKHEEQIADVPGSPNHGAATGRNANNAGPTANTSPDSAAPAQNTTTSPYSHPGVEFTQLQNEIRNLEDLIVKAQKDLVDLEVFKERSVRNLNIPPTIDATTVMELDNNPAIQQQKKQLLELTSTLQTKLSVSENPDDADIKRLRASMQEAEAELAKRRSEAASTFREKIAQMNKEVLRSAMTEYKVRRKSCEDNLVKHQQELAAAKTKLAQLKGEAASDSPNQIAAATGNTTDDTTPVDLKHRQKKTIKFILNAEAAANIKSQLAANAEWLGLENYEWAGDDSWVNVTGDDDKLKAFAEYVDKFDPFRTTTDDVARSVVDEPQPGALDPFDSAARRTKASSLSPFPTLENQKIADRAYKLLGLELEPLTPEELERVKKLGYAGGLRVVAVDPLKQKHLALFPDVLLVGLHVWPTTDLQSLDAILTREDLGDLAPLKYRAIANVPTEETRRSDNPVMEDRLITGRMPIDLEAFRSIRQSLTSNHANAAKVPPSEAKPASDFDAITVIQAPTSQKSSIFGGTVTTAYLKVKFDRLPYSVDAPHRRLSPQEIEGKAMTYLTLLRSSWVMKAALKSFTPRDAQALPQKQAVVWLQDRLSTTFPGDGEILELKLEGGDAREDSALLQAVIDAFIAAVKAPPESPADPNAAATVLPGDLSSSTRPEVDAASAAAEYPKAFAAALEQSRKQGKPVVVHFLAHNSEPSQRFVDEILANEQVVKFIDEHFIPVTIYADDEPAFAEAFQISRVPVDMFVFAGGDCTYGGITTPATPADYLAHLKTYHKLATTPERQYPTPNPYIPEVAPAPVADRPANDQKPAATVDAGDAVSLKVAGAFPEAPLDGVFTIEPAGTLPLGPLYGRVVVAGKTVLEAEAAVKEHLSRTLTDVAVQLTLGPNPATTAEAPTPAAGSSPTFLYDGKTFEEWRDLWKLELNPERRIEAINALAAFGRAGYGQEAAKEILDVAAQYRNDGTSSDLLSAINLAIGRMPADHWMPQVLQRLQSSDGPQRDVWRQHAKNYLQSSRDFGPEARALAAKFANDPADGLLNVTANYLLRYDQKLEDQLTIDLVRKALSEDANHGETLQYLGFRNLDKVPEQLDLLVRDQRARGELHQLMQQQFMQRGVDGYGAPELVAPMLAILNAPNRADDHVGAIRTLKAMSPALRRRGMEAERLQVVEQLTTILRDGPDELLLPAWAALSHISETAAENIPREYVNEGKISAEQGKRLREFDQQELIDEANAD